MARSHNDDPLMQFNFALMEVGTTSREFDGEILDATIMRDSRKRTLGEPLIGFQSISVPEVTVEYLDIIEGNWPFPHKVPLTKATTGDVTISQAVFTKSSDFYVWIHQALYGRGSPRRHFQIVYLDSSKIFIPNLTGSRKGKNRQIKLYNCMPVTWTPGGELSADSGEVAIESLTFNVERLEIQWNS